MKSKFNYIFLILLIFMGCTWSKETKVLYSAAVATQAADFLQTREILTNDDYYEMNPLIKQENLEGYIISVNVVILIVAHFIPDDYRKILFSYITGAEVVNIWHNYERGIRIQKEW